MEAVLGALVIFVLRICDVSIGTMRTMFTVRGMRQFSSLLGFLEAAIWVLAIRHVFNNLDSWWNLFGYAGGYAAGNFTGITIERWIASGWVMLRVISIDKAAELRSALGNGGFGVTCVAGQGRNGEVDVLFVVAKRKRGNEAIRLVQTIDEDAFVTIDPVTPASGGYLPHVSPGGVKK
ncbi:MAG: DUF2179 domain-containing protein [Phycisphaerales bacterium]|nr:DUF2179 domain-containing protein [Phycisphaerales bacterium]